MMKHISTIFTLAFAASALLLSSCAKDLGGDGSDEAPLSFGSTTEDIFEVKAQRKTSTVTSFTVAGFDNSGKQWFPKTDVNTSTTYYEYRWRSGMTYKFFGYSNLPGSGASTSISKDGVTLTYTQLPADANQTDAVLGRYSGTGSSGKATLNFYHPLASVQFKVGTITNVVSIDKISLIGVYASGSTALTATTTPLSGDANDFSWENTSGSVTVSQTTSVSTFTTDASIGTPFIVIPQALGTDKVTISMKVTLSGGVTKTISTDLSTGAFVAGKTTAITVSYDGGKDLNFTASLIAWNNTAEQEMDLEKYVDRGPKPDEIWYWTSNEQPLIVWSDKYNSWQWTRNGGEIYDSQYDVNPVSKFGSDIVSSTYTPGGKGVIKFAAPITKIGNYGFSNIWGWGSEKITKMVFPEGVLELESEIFDTWGGYGAEVIIPKSVTTIVPGCGGTFYQSFCPVTVGYVDGITYSRDTHPSQGSDSYFNWAFYLTLGNGVTYEVWSCCFAKGTLITLADGTKKKVEDLTYSDKLKVWNFDDGEDDSANILWITKAGLKAPYFFRCTLSDGTVLDLIGEEDEGTHRLYNKTAGKFEYPDQMAPGSKVYTEHGLVEVVSFERIDEEVGYYNLITDKDINCYANEVLTSCRYNNIYPIDQDMKFVKDGRKIRPYKEFKAAGISREWYVGMRLGEQTYDVEDVASYIGRCESQMAEKPAPTFWQKLRTWWKSIFG